MKKVKKEFCYHCGTQLMIKLINRHYDTNTGKEIFNKLWFCPKLSIFKCCHSRFNADPNGDPPDYPMP